MSQNSRTTLRPAPLRDDSAALLDRLLSQFPELSRDEASNAAAGVAALPGVQTGEPPQVTVSTPPRYRA